MITTGNNFVLIITAISFLAIFLFCIGMLQYARMRTRRREMVDRIRYGGVIGTPTGDRTHGKNTTMGTKLLGFLGRIGNRYAPKESVDYSKLRTKFLRAGIRWENAGAALWGCKLFLLILLPAAVLLLRMAGLFFFSTQLSLFFAIFFALVGFYAPDIWLQNKGNRRKEKLLKALPDALDLLVVCVEAGMGLDSAFNKVAQEMLLSSPELSDEFKLYSLELRAGKSRQNALRNLAIRSALEEMESLVTLLIQADRFGTSVASALSVFSESFRTQRYQRAEEKAAKLPVKLIFPMILFIFPSLFVVIMGPAAIQVYKNFILK